MVIDIKNDKDEIVGKASYANGKLHGRCIRYFPNTNDIDVEHNYNNGIKHGECIKYNGSFRYVEYYNLGILIKTENIFETYKYLGITETTYEKLPDGPFVDGYFKTHKEIKKTLRLIKQ